MLDKRTRPDYCCRMFYAKRKKLTKQDHLASINKELVDALFNCVKIYPDLASNSSVQKAIGSFRDLTLQTRSK
jgi:hypothetical protein